MNPKNTAYLIAAGLLAGLLFTLYYQHNKIKSQKVTIAQVTADKNIAIQTINTIQQDAEKTRKLLEGYENVKTQIEYVDRIVTKDVIRYRERVVNRCELSNDWVRIHDQATASVYTESPATGVNGATGRAGTPIDDAEALAVVTNNYRMCIADQAKLRALQAWALNSSQ